MGLHRPRAISKSLISMVMGAGKRCISLMESPKSEAQMHVLFLKINMHWRVLTSRDVVKNEGGWWGTWTWVSTSACRTPEGRWRGQQQGSFCLLSHILPPRLQERGDDLSQGPFFPKIRLKTMSWKIWHQLIFSVMSSHFLMGHIKNWGFNPAPKWISSYLPLLGFISPDYSEVFQSPI